MMLRKSEVPFFKDTLGWVYYQRRDYKNALTLLEEAAAALPGVAAVRYHLGMAYLADGQTEKGVEQFNTALGLTTDNVLQSKLRAAKEKAASL